jgi:hypothetical protein
MLGRGPVVGEVFRQEEGSGSRGRVPWRAINVALEGEVEAVGAGVSLPVEQALSFPEETKVPRSHPLLAAAVAGDSPPPVKKCPPRTPNNGKKNPTPSPPGRRKKNPRQSSRRALHLHRNRPLRQLNLAFSVARITSFVPWEKSLAFCVYYVMAYLGRVVREGSRFMRDFFRC